MLQHSKETMNRETKKQKFNTDYSRREFIKAGALTVGAAAALTVSGYATAQAVVKPKGLPLSMAGYNFDRTRALIDGSVNSGCRQGIQTEGLLLLWHRAKS